jgi:hypothetical protein
MTAPAMVESAELCRVQVKLAGHVVIDHIIDADRAAWFAGAMSLRYRSCRVTWAPYVAADNELVEARPGEQP